jgi:translation initiation factor 1
LPANPDEEEPSFNEYLEELDKDQVRIIIRVETRKFRKPTTIISGLPEVRGEIQKVTHELKKKLATGGTSKQGQIILQGDHRESAKETLVKLGYTASNIEVQ